MERNLGGSAGVALVVGIALVLSMGISPTVAADHDPPNNKLTIDLSSLFIDPIVACFTPFEGVHVDEEVRVQEDRQLVPEGFEAEAGGGEREVAGEQVDVPGVSAGVGDLNRTATFDIDEERSAHANSSQTRQQVGGDRVFVPGVSIVVGDEEVFAAGGEWVELPGEELGIGVDRNVTVGVQQGFDGNVTVDETVTIDQTVNGLTVCIELPQL
ncbi:hypothetical protein BRD56_12875 [Thermoplasmatales archaeon SW_10_69_26]|nr:MAG: hypothetical protein BRD56_12875 [Thermoplasmatales archaeon SW_10_69_26]